MNPLAMITSYRPKSRRSAHIARSLATAIFISAALGGCGEQGSNNAPPPLEGADIGGSFTLENTDGKTVKWSDFDGKYRIVYFGYAYCPDICPTDVQRMTKGLDDFAKQEPERAKRVQPIFISVDPERDTPEVIAQFTKAFSDRLIGLTGTPEQIESAAKTFRVYYSRGEDTPGGGYLVNHTAITYLFDPDGEPLATLPTDQGPEAVAAELDKWVR